MSAQVKIFSPTSPHSLLRVSYDNTVDDALADIWNDSETDFLRRKIAFNQLSLRSLCSPISSEPWDSIRDRVDKAYNSGFVIANPPDRISQHATPSGSTIQLVLHITESSALSSLPTNIQRAYHDAGERLHDALWKRSLEFRNTSEDQDQGEKWRYVAEEYMDDLNELGYGQSCLLIRQEYDTAFEDLQGLRRAAEENKLCGVVVTGQPGIGKTCFLYYLLLYLLHKKIPVSLERDQHILVFQDDGVNVYDKASGVLPNGCWALSDSNHRSEIPCITFEYYAVRHTAWIVQATSPSEKRWKEWTKQLGADFYVMKPFTLNEMRALGKLLSLKVDIVHHIFSMWGPSARNCIQLSRVPEKEANYEEKVQSTAQSFVTEGHSMASFNPYKVSHHLFSVGPKDDSVGGRQVMVAEFATKRIETIVAHAVASTHAQDQLKFYNLLSKHKWLRSSQAAGHLFELLVLSWLSASSDVPPLTCSPAEGALTINIPAPGEDATIFIGSPTGSKEAINKMLKTKTTLCLLPVVDNFPTADAIVLTKAHLITIQVTIANSHSANPDGFTKIKEYIPATVIKTRKWCHVFITDDEKSAKSLRKPLPQSPGIGVYSAVFNYGWAKDDLNIRYEDMEAFEEKRQRAQEVEGAKKAQDRMDIDEAIAEVD